MSPFTRYVLISATLLSPSVPIGALMGTRYGGAAGRRMFVGMAGSMVAQQLLVGIALLGRGSTREPHSLTLVDSVTLTRGISAAVMVGVTATRIQDRRGLAGWTGWLSLLYGAIACDWLDGPIARRLGPSETGTVLDLESDSWLTLCSALAAIAWGKLPRAVIIPPLLRYLLLFSSLSRTPYAELQSEEPAWGRLMGISQMLIFIAALAPFRGRATSWIVRTVAPVQAPLQICGLCILQRRRGVL